MLAAKDAGYDLTRRKMTLLGAGGAATSILVQAALDGLAEISVFSIHDQFYARAEQIVQTLNERTNCKYSCLILKTIPSFEERLQTAIF